MNSRWFLVQGSTLKRVNMEREREKALLEELRRLKGPAREQKARRDNLLRLIRKLQKQQALGPPAVGARLPSLERAVVAQAVEAFLMSTGSPTLGPSEPPSTSHRSRSPLSTEFHLVRLENEPEFYCSCGDPQGHLRGSARGTSD